MLYFLSKERRILGMFTKFLYGAAILGLLLSFVKDKAKTKLALKKAWRSFENILPSILVILLLIGFIFAFLDAQAISKLLGTDYCHRCWLYYFNSWFCSISSCELTSDRRSRICADCHFYFDTYDGWHCYITP